MGNGELMIYGEHPLTAKEVKAQVNLIQEVMQSVMKKDEHYGTIPGTPKPTLYKPGAEKIMATFRLAAEPVVEDLSVSDSIRYRVQCRILTLRGLLVGIGVGECSTDEEKYRWRRAVNNTEFEETPEDRRREKWVKGYKDKEDYKVKQIRTVPADLANTVLKMAKKRALVDAVLTATAASDIFAQDLEDLPDELRDAATDAAKKPLKEPQAKGAPAAAKPQGKVKDTLKEELRAYCGGDEEKMKATLRELTTFEGDKGTVAGKDSVDALSDKWAASTLGKLRERVKNEEHCTENPDSCEKSKWDDKGVPFCGENGPKCRFIPLPM